MVTQKNNWINNDLFREIVDNLPICTVDVLFFNKENSKILLFKRNNEPAKGIYFSIGGRLFKNEDFKEGAVRQAKRELRIVINKNKLIFGGVINEICQKSISKNLNTHAVDIYWGYIIEDSDIDKMVLDNQHSEYKWFNVTDNSLHPFMKEKIKNLMPKLN